MSGDLQSAGEVERVSIVMLIEEARGIICPSQASTIKSDLLEED